MLSPTPDRVLDRLREICLALPEATELVSHGIPAFRVAAKMFAYFRHDHHGDGRTVVCIKTAGRDEQEHLIESDPDLFSWPAYIGPSGWISMKSRRRRRRLAPGGRPRPDELPTGGTASAPGHLVKGFVPSQWPISAGAKARQAGLK